MGFDAMSVVSDQAWTEKRFAEMFLHDAAGSGKKFSSSQAGPRAWPDFWKFGSDLETKLRRAEQGSGLNLKMSGRAAISSVWLSWTFERFCLFLEFQKCFYTT